MYTAPKLVTIPHLSTSNIIGRVDHGLARTIKESMYLRSTIPYL